MKIVLQRVKEARVTVAGQVVGSIGRGLCLLVGVEKGDREVEADWLAAKVAELRIFPDENDRMNLSVKDINGSILAVSQFTLASSIKKGRRPSFDNAESPDRAAELFDYFIRKLKEQGLEVQTGVFQAMMEVQLVNDGPVTFILDSRLKQL
ncbi:MAG TPA: D-tyrosyl-tRNA(Tyr) deacylase [Acidobacteria bacterium]|nr:D-tyrosyl-tRNA(Tyr) deacylase [Acidobacteriota bacterium]